MVLIVSRVLGTRRSASAFAKASADYPPHVHPLACTSSSQRRRV